MKLKAYAVLYCDYGESCDGKPRLQGIYATKEEAKKEVLKDMDQYISGLEPDIEDIHQDRIKYSVVCDENDMSCEWAIEEFEISMK